LKNKGRQIKTANRIKGRQKILKAMGSKEIRKKLKNRDRKLKWRPRKKI